MAPADDDDLFAALRELPPTARAGQLERANKAFRCVPATAVEVVSTSGADGKPLLLYLTDTDLEKLATVEARTFAAAELGPGDVVQLCVTMDSLFMAGLAYYMGLRRRGCTVLRQGAAGPEHRLELMIRNRVTGVVTVPSFLLAIGSAWRGGGFDDASRTLRKAVLVGENIRNEALGPNELARRIGDCWDVELYGNFGNSRDDRLLLRMPVPLRRAYPPRHRLRRSA